MGSLLRIGNRVLARARRVPALLQDLILALLVSQADLTVLLAEGTSRGAAGVLPRWGGALIILLVATPLVFRRTSPTTVMILTGFGAGAAVLLGVPVGSVGPIVALYTVAAYESLHDSVVSTVIFFGVTFGLLVRRGELSVLYTNSLLIVGITIVGRIVQAYRQQTAALEAQNTELQQQRRERQELGAKAERARIAREMHDILAHSVSVMVVQAAGARRLLPAKPAAAADAMGVVEETGRASLVEIRRVLGLLRQDAAADHAEPDVVAGGPQPGIADLDQLVAEYEAAGLEVELRTGRDLQDGVGTTVALSAYRIVQEALTNVLKHVGPTKVLVQVRIAGRRLHVDVFDQGRQEGAPPGREPADATDGAGFGVVGMRERAALVGGTLDAGPRAGGGYRVVARIPVDGADGDRSSGAAVSVEGSIA